MSDSGGGLFELSEVNAARARFEPARLTQARLAAGITKVNLAAAVGVTPAAIGQYEAGVNVPRSDVMERLSHALDVRADFFCGGRPIARTETMHAYFRSLRSARVKDRNRALAMAAELWEITFAVERYVNLPTADLPKVEPGTSPACAAQILREAWSIPAGPVRHLVATAESMGVIVAVRPVGEIDTVDAFSVIVVDRPLIITTPRRTENVFRHRFSIAHELGHLVMHGETEERTSSMEAEADEFAAAFLTPASFMDAELPSTLNLSSLDRVGRKWGVSTHSLIRRMVERGRTTESSARRAYQRLNAMGEDSGFPASSFPGELPTLLKTAVEVSADNGAGEVELSEMLKMDVRRFRELVGIPDSRPKLRIIPDL